MARFVRFEVLQRVAGESRRVGVFTAAYDLRREGDLFAHDRERLDGLLAWFGRALTVPPRGAIPERALFWFRDAGPFASRAWELSGLLDDYGYAVELVTARSVGRVVYRDEHQLAALPPSRRHR